MPDRALGALALGAAAALLAAGPALAAGPVVDRVPSAIPSAGFRITGCCTFVRPPVAQGLITPQRALRLARSYAGANWARPSLLLATLLGPVTVAVGTPRMRTIRNPTAWLVTYDARKPVRVGLGSLGAGPPMRHYSVAVDAKSGDFIRGFYTA